MFKKIIEKVANAGTVALLGYEIGTHVDHETENKQVEIENHESHSEIIVIIGIIIIIAILASIATKILFKNRRLV